MGRRKNRQAGEKTTSEYDSEPEEMVCGEEEEPGADMEEGGAMGVAGGVLGTLGAEESRLRCDTGAERRGTRGVPNEEIRDLLLTVSQSVSHITGALQHVVAVLQKKDSEVGHVEVDKNQTHAYLGGSIPRGTSEEFPWQPVTEQTRHTERRDADERCMMEPANREPGCSGETHYKPMQSSSSVEHGLAERGRYTRNQVNEGSHRNMMQMELEGCAGVGPTQHLPQRLAEKSGYTRDPANEGSNRNCNRFQFEPDMSRGVGPNQHQPQNRRHSRAGQMLDSGRQEAEGMDFRGRRQGSEGANRSVKIPPFNGKEEWNVWINRFEIIAFTHMWSKEEKLDNLIPRIEGNAAEFIFSQLPQHILHDFDLLVGELNNRYRRIETPRTFAAKFSSRNQKNGETAEEYAAELKSLYDRAHGFRDAATRQEDLVRRFWDGLWDDEARFEVEFHKEPTTIDEAVYFVVCLIQTKRQMGDKAGDRQRRPVREARNTEEDEVLDDAESIGRVPGKFRTGDKGKLESARGVSSPGDKITSMPSKDNKLDDTKDILKLIMEKLEKLVPAPRERESSRKPEPYVNPGVTCFRCGEKGHYARECPKGPRDLNRRRGDKPFYRDGQAMQNTSNGSQQNSHLN